MVEHVQRNLEAEVEHAARELAERYEEINLLYTISEILGRTVSLEEVASTILEELSQTVGARYASLLVHDTATDRLEAAATRGIPLAEVAPISVRDERCVSARVFLSRHPLIVEQGSASCEAERVYRGDMLCVPIMWTGPAGPAPLGVVNLAGRRTSQPFTAGDLKLVAAIATQIGTAIQNARLVRQSIEQQRLLQEVRLAHDLQMKLLPEPNTLSPDLDVAARVVPAESVGGDFYNLFRLGARRVGLMIGDVSSHGYRAALIMALSMSAAAIHAQRNRDPAKALAALVESLRGELEMTEMFISAFYGIVDMRQRKLRYANAGHPHAFAMGGNGEIERLRAGNPPLGMCETLQASTVRSWTPDDTLVLFTDGIADAHNRHDERLGEERVLRTIVTHRARPVQEIADRVFEVMAEHTGEVRQRDDLTLVIARA